MNTIYDQAGALAALLFSFARTSTKLKPLWNWVPSKYQWAPPLLAIALPQIAEALQGAKTTEQLVQAALVAVALLAPGIRSALHKEAVGAPATPGSQRGLVVAEVLGVIIGLASTVFLLFGVVFVVQVIGCSPDKPAASPDAGVPNWTCTTTEAAELAAECAAKVKRECADRGVKQEDCQPLKDCDAAADARLEECRP